MENADCGRTCVEVDSFNNVIAKLIYFSVTSDASVTSMKIMRYSGNQLTGNFIRLPGSWGPQEICTSGKNSLAGANIERFLINLKFLHI